MRDTGDTSRMNAIPRSTKSLVALLALASVALLWFLYVGRPRTHPTVRKAPGIALAQFDLNRTHGFSSKRSPFRQPNETCQKRFPGAIIAGIQKCRTAALSVIMNLHPEIAAALRPTRNNPDGNTAMEPQFFTIYYHKGFDWYLNLMPCSYSNQITIEKDPPYFFESYCPERIKRFDPATKIILIVKEPVKRAISQYAMTLNAGAIANKTFEEVVSNKEDKRKMLQLSTYTDYIDAWIKHFGLKQMHFVDGHLFEKDPVSELKKLEKFLNLAPYFQESMFWYNETKGKQCFYSLNEKKPKCMAEFKGLKHPDISEDLRIRLQRHFKPMNELFFKKIHRRFNWGY